MKNKGFIVILVALVGVIVVAGMFYGRLSDGNSPNNLQLPSTLSSGESASSPNSGGESSTTDERKLPDFTIEDKDGEEVTIQSKFGKPMVINIWASWCGPCSVEMPYFQKAYEKYGENIEFVMINATGTEKSIDDAKKYLEKHGYTFPVYYDTENEAAYTLGITGYPTTYLLSAEGVPLTAAVGVIDEQVLMDALEILMQL